MHKPILQAMVLADHVYQDRTTGKFIICGTFGRIGFGTRKIEVEGEGTEQRQVTDQPLTQIGSPYLYLALFEVHNPLPLALKFVNLSDSSVLFEAAFEVTAQDPLRVAEYVLPLPMLPANAPGTYSLDLLHEDEILGSWRIAVVNVTPEGGF